MKMRFALVPALLLAIGSSTAMAQGGGMGGPGGRGGMANRRMQAMMNGITLTPAQQTQVDSIVARYRAQMPAFTPGSRPDEATMQTMRDLNTRQTAEIRAVLTPAQQAVFDTNVAAMRNRGGRGPGGGQ